MFHTDDDNCWSKRKKKTFITKLTVILSRRWNRV